MRKKRIVELREKLKKIIPNPTKQQWRRWKTNYLEGYVN